MLGNIPLLQDPLTVLTARLVGMQRLARPGASACCVVWITTLVTRQRSHAKNVTLGSTKTKKEPLHVSSVMLVKS